MPPPARTILLRISNTGIHLNNEKLVSWSNTNLPSKSTFQFSDHKPHFWRVRQDVFERVTGTLTITIINYSVSDPEPHFSNQSPKAEVKNIRFAYLNWSELETQLSAYKKDGFTNLLKSASKISQTNKPVESPIVKRVRIEGRIPLNRLTFKIGYVECLKRLPGMPDPIQIILPNPHILPEFEAIKPFFGKLLGKRTIEFTGVVELIGKLVKKVACSSVDLDRINDDSISSVRRIVLKDSLKTASQTRLDKGLFGSGELFEDTPANAFGNTYRNHEKLLLEEIIEAHDVRNRPQLQFLAGQIHEVRTPLKFTLQPDFGFLFHYRGETMHHFLWELLNTNATYVWSLPAGPFTLPQAYQLLEREINAIREHGRMTYLHHTDNTAFVFNRVSHEHRNSDFIDGFPKWRARIMEMMV